MKIYVHLGAEPNEEFSEHYRRFTLAHDWCVANIGEHGRKWSFNMRGGEVPFLFDFKKSDDAIRFKLKWGIP